MMSNARPSLSDVVAPHGMNAMPTVARGSDLRVGEPHMTVCNRHGNPPLRFKGCALSRHWVQMSSDILLNVELFQRLKGKFVLSYSIVIDARIVSDAVQLCDISAATAHLEAVCAKADAPLMDMREGAAPWADAYFYLCFGQCFAVLVSDVLDDWHALFKMQE